MSQFPQDSNAPQNPENPVTPEAPAQHGAPLDAEQQAATSSYAANPAEEQKPKKSKAGLIIGLLLAALLIAAAILAFIFLSGPKTKSFEDLSSGMTEVGKESGMENCHNYEDTIIGESSPLSEDEEMPDDAKAFVCSSIDLTNMDAVMSAVEKSEEPKVMLGIFSESTNVKEDDLGDFGDMSGEEWGLKDEHWGVYSTNVDAKDAAQKKLGGELTEGK